MRPAMREEEKEEVCAQNSLWAPMHLSTYTLMNMPHESVRDAPPQKVGGIHEA